MAESLTFHKKRRAVIRCSLKKLSTRLTKLEADTAGPALLENVKSFTD